MLESMFYIDLVTQGSFEKYFLDKRANLWMKTRKMHSQNLHITEQMSNQERWNTWNKTLSRFSGGLYTAVCIYIYIVTSAFCDLMSSEIIILSKLGAWHGIIAAQQDLNDNITIEQLYSYIHRVEAPASIGPPGDSVIEGRKSWNFEKKTSLKMSCDQGTPHLHFVVDLLLPGVSVLFSLRTMAHWPNCFSARFDVLLLWSTELDCQTLTIRWWRFVSICGCHFRIIFNDDILQQAWINDVLSSFSCWTVTVCGEKKLFVPRWRNVHGQSNICLWLSIFHSAVDPLILVDSAGARPSQLFSEARHTPFTKLQAKAGSGRRTTVDDILWKKHMLVWFCQEGRTYRGVHSLLGISNLCLADVNTKSRHLALDVLNVVIAEGRRGSGGRVEWQMNIFVSLMPTFCETRSFAIFRHKRQHLGSCPWCILVVLSMSPKFLTHFWPILDIDISNPLTLHHFFSGSLELVFHQWPHLCHQWADCHRRNTCRHKCSENLGPFRNCRTQLGLNELDAFNLMNLRTPENLWGSQSGVPSFFLKSFFWSEDWLLLFWCPSWCQSVDAWSYRLHVFRQGQCILVLFHRWMPATIWSRWHRRASRPTAHRGDPAVSVGGLQWQVTPLGEAPLPAGAASQENGFVATKIRTCWFLFVTWWSEDMNSKVPIVNPSFPMPVQYTWGQEFRWVKL